MNETSTEAAANSVAHGPHDAPLPPIEWTRLCRDAPEVARKFLAVMAEMDRHYRDEEPPDALERMTSEGCHYFYGSGAGFEVAVGFQWDDKRQKFQLRTAGFRGTLAPLSALRLMIELSRDFLRQAKQIAVFTIVPRKMDNYRIMQLHGLVPWAPELQVTGGHQVEGGTYWKLQLAALEQPSH